MTASSFWSQAGRETLLTRLNERAYTAVDERGLDAINELRDRALAALLAHSVCEAGAILRDPGDQRRSGIRWRDIDLEAE